jgi:hypothetical protein
MYPPTLFIIIYYALFWLSCPAFTAAASADCFKQQRDSYTTSAKDTKRISAGVACPESAAQPCSLETGGFVNATSTLNITTGNTAEVFAAVGRAANTQFAVFLNGSVANQTITVEPGRTGYFGFTVTYRCYAGVLEDCRAEVGVPNGTAVEACQPATLDSETSQGVPIMDGSGSFVDTDQKTIADMTTNPAAETTRNEPSEDSGAVKLGTGNALLTAISMVIMGWGGWLVI